MPWDDALKKKADDAVIRMEGEGHRVMAAAFRDLDPATFDAEGDLLGYVTDLEMTSLVAMVDPPRDESKAAVRDAQRAQIRVRMVTGDDVTTGAAIAKQLGIPGSAMLGSEFAALSEEERLARIDDIGVVGRVAPEHKVLLVETLRKKGEVVAMTGDGVNDAPAIKAADIGIAMGTGTQVAKNASRMILSDDNFATIMRAVEQGRAVYDNLNKFIRFVMLELVAYIITFLGASILNIAAGQPFSPSQILYINFLVNAPLGVALGMDKEAPGLMSLKPRSRDASIMTTGLLTTAGLVGLFMAVCTLVLISYGTSHYGSVDVGTSMGVTAFSLLLIAAAFQARSVTATALTTETFDNRSLNWTAARGARARRAHHPDGRPAPPVRDRAAVAHTMGAGAGARRGALRPLGAREADRPSPGGSFAAGDARRGRRRVNRCRDAPRSRRAECRGLIRGVEPPHHGRRAGPGSPSLPGGTQVQASPPS